MCNLAAQYIREHAAESIKIKQVASRLAFSSRWLERHFKKVLGRSPHEELQRCRLEMAKRMLLETDLKAAKIASASGFASPSYFTSFFRRRTAQTPLQFRSSQRLGRKDG